MILKFIQYIMKNEEKLAVAELFIRNLKNKIGKHMIEISKNIYIGKLPELMKNHNSAIHS